MGRRRVGTLSENFWPRVDVRGPNDCWEWTGSCTNSGYGSYMWGGRTYVTHRIAAWLTGLVPAIPAPEDKQSDGFVLHQCDNRPCCNPAHFKVGTFSQNQKESYARKRRAQPRGPNHANSKLTAAQAREIRRAYASGEAIQDELAKKYNVSQVAISLITRGKTYV